MGWPDGTSHIAGTGAYASWQNLRPTSARSCFSEFGGGSCSVRLGRIKLYEKAGVKISAIVNIKQPMKTMS
jgi:hypothetical protein